MADPILLQMKYARVVEEFGKIANISWETALDFFYHSATYELIREGISDLHCHSDGSIPRKTSLTELENGISQGWIVEEQDPFGLHGDVSERDRALRDAVWNKMKAALLDEPGIYDRKRRC